MEETQNKQNQSTRKYGSDGPSQWLRWSWLLGGLGGALIVGAVWFTTDRLHSGDPVTAQVGSTQIRQSQLVSKLESSSGSSMLEQMIVNQLVEDGAKKANITASQTDLSNALSSFEAQNGITDSTELSQVLAQNGVSQADFNEMLKVQVLAQKLSEKGITVTDKEIQDYYNKNKSQFVTTTGSKKPQPLSKVKSQIKQILIQNKAIPTDQLIANLAKQDNVKIFDTQYSSIMTDLESTSNATSNSTANTTGNSAATGNTAG